MLHAPAARKRSASAATGACCAVTLRTAPCPLRSLTLPARSLRGLRKPRSGSCSAGGREEQETIHPCTSTSAFAHSLENMLITSRRSARSVAPCSKASHAENNARIGHCGKLPGCAPYNERAGRRAALYHWRFSAPSRFHVEGSGRSQSVLTHISFRAFSLILLTRRTLASLAPQHVVHHRVAHRVD